MFILAAIFIGIAFIATIAWWVTRDSTPWFVPLSAWILAMAVTAMSCLSTVPTRNVGIVTAFGKPTGRTTGAGLQWTAPWQDVDDWDASGQTFSHLGDQCVWVTIAAQRRACIPVQIEWSAKADAAPENWAAYKETDGKSRFETYVARRIEPQVNSALTSIFAGFDPLGGVSANAGDTAAPDLNKTYKTVLTTALAAELGNEITIKSIAFEAPRYDDPTTAAIAAYGQKVLEARNLEIDKANAKTRAEITRTDASVDQVARCLQIAEKLGKEPGLCMGAGAMVTKPIG